MPHENMIRRMKRLYVSIAIVFLNTIVLLLILNGLCFLGRLVKNEQVPQSDLVTFDYAPYRMMKICESPWELNEQGFRAKPFEQYRDKNKFRIVFLGGSVCQGFGRDTGLPLPALLERHLHGLGLTDIEVVNLGQGGAVSGQELAILIQYGLKLNPQLVVSFNGANDLLHAAPLGSDMQPNLPYLNQSMKALWANARSPGAYLLNSTSLGKGIKRLKEEVRRRPGHSLPGVPVRQVTESYMYGMEVTHRLLASFGVEHIVLLQPMVAIDKPLTIEEQQHVRIRCDSPEKVTRCRQLYDASAALLRDYAQRSDGFEFYDLRRAFEHEHETIYMDSVHFANDKGYPQLLSFLRDMSFIDRIVSLHEQWKQDEATNVSEAI